MGHYDEFREAAQERRYRDERLGRCRRIVTVEQEIEYHQTNAKLYGIAHPVGFTPIRPEAWRYQ